MNNTYEFFIVGRARDKENILKIFEKIFSNEKELEEFLREYNQ